MLQSPPVPLAGGLAPRLSSPMIPRRLFTASTLASVEGVSKVRLDPFAADRLVDSSKTSPHSTPVHDLLARLLSTDCQNLLDSDVGLEASLDRGLHVGAGISRRA